MDFEISQSFPSFDQHSDTPIDKVKKHKGK